MAQEDIKKYIVIREKKSNRIFGLFRNKKTKKIYTNKLTIFDLDNNALTLKEAEELLSSFKEEQKDWKRNNIKNKSDRWLATYMESGPYFLMKTDKIRNII